MHILGVPTVLVTLTQLFLSLIQVLTVRTVLVLVCAIGDLTNFLELLLLMKSMLWLELRADRMYEMDG